MGSIRRKLAGMTAKLLDLPQDLVEELPRLIMIGNRELIIQNHAGVLHFSDRLLCLRLKQGELEIEGEALVIHGIMTEEVRIVGKIGEIRYKS